jgi:ElaB/YqjD/DUF883 family membrane-anchored ribosome-binding protein
MGETVNALGYKADVPARARDSINDKVDNLRSMVTGTREHVSDATPDATDIQRGAKQAAGIAQENPLGLALGAAAVGFLAGVLVPSTKLEDERIGPLAEEVKQQLKQTGEAAVEQTKQVAQETASNAAEKAQEAFAEVKDTARQSAESHGQELSDTARQSAEHVQQAVPGGR